MLKSLLPEFHWSRGVSVDRRWIYVVGIAFEP